MRGKKNKESCFVNEYKGKTLVDKTIDISKRSFSINEDNEPQAFKKLLERKKLSQSIDCVNQPLIPQSQKNQTTGNFTLLLASKADCKSERDTDDDIPRTSSFHQAEKEQ